MGEASSNAMGVSDPSRGIRRAEGDQTVVYAGTLAFFLIPLGTRQGEHRIKPYLFEHDELGRQCSKEVESSVLTILAASRLRGSGFCGIANECFWEEDASGMCSVFPVISLVWILCMTWSVSGSVWTYTKRSSSTPLRMSEGFATEYTDLILPGECAGDDTLLCNGLVRFILALCNKERVSALVGNVPYLKYLRDEGDPDDPWRVLKNPCYAFNMHSAVGPDVTPIVFLTKVVDTLKRLQPTAPPDTVSVSSR